jgi:hypothetical protein
MGRQGGTNYTEENLQEIVKSVYPSPFMAERTTPEAKR